MPCKECQAFRKVVAASFVAHLEIFWHYGQIIPADDRHKLAQLVPQLLGDDEEDKERIRNEIADLLMGHEVQMIFRSKHKEIPYRVFSCAIQ